MGTPADRICARLGAELSLCMRSIGVVGLAALALLAAVQASSAADRVRVAITAGLADAPTIVARERGYFAQENIELEPVVFASAAQAIVPLASKELDVAGGAVSASLYNAIDRGVNLKAVAGRSRTSAGIPYITVFIRRDHIDSGRFKTLADLKGMKFALIARGIAVHALFEAMLKKAGLKPSDVEIVYLDYPQQSVALKTGGIDATFMGEPYATSLVTENLGVRFMNTDEIISNYVITVFIYGDTLLKDRPQVGHRFMKALLRGIRDYNDVLDDKGLMVRAADDIIKAFQREFKVDQHALRTVYSHSVDPNGKINLTSVEADFEYLKGAKLISGKVSPNALIDTSFVDKAVAELGPYERKP
jgi:NitT/TauT family transport system substrate-binding protein